MTSCLADVEAERSGTRAKPGNRGLSERNRDRRRTGAAGPFPEAVGCRYLSRNRYARALSYRLTEAAASDIAGIPRETSRQFGSLQRRRYTALIARAIEMAAEQLDRPGSRPRDELAAALRSLHIETAARRRGAAAHVIYYLCARSAEAHDGIVVARVLHDHMEPLRHLARADVTGALR